MNTIRDIETLDKEIQELQEKIEELNQEKTEIEELPEEAVVAEYLHDELCNHNHEDGCGWFYESWKVPGRAKSRYLSKANQLMRQGKSLNDVKEIVEAYKSLKPR